jgi:hypothetical protein
MGQKFTWHKRFAIGESLVIIGIAGLLHFYRPSPITVPLLFLSFGTLCATIKSLWPRRRPHEINEWCGS